MNIVLRKSLPALARILAKHYGFNCTVLWALDDKEISFRAAPT